ncbi:MAG TPA: glycosyltransferase family 4 protein [Thermoanaerobaculia bacterium]|nr:glycosyltransferase family 4 protein [Thermoanaerobaculia bacterium]
MKILHVVATAEGAPWMVALAREQQRLGHEVAAVIPSLDGGLARDLARAGIAAHAAPVDVRALLRLVALLRRLRPDVVHSHIFPSVIAARLASWLADAPIHLGGNVHPISLESDSMRALEIGTAFCDTKTIASCRYTRELYVAHGVPAEQVELIHYAVDQSGHDPALADGARVRRELGLAPDTPVVGMIAYFYPPPRTPAVVPPELRGRGVKGHDVLLRAVPLVLQQVPGAKFVLVGRGWGPDGARYEQDLKDLAASLGVAHAVLFPGERTDVPDVLASFDVSVHCSLSDNLGGTVESLLMERPMVVSDILGFADTVLHEETGLVVPKDDPRALADAIVLLLRDRELAARLGRNGRAYMLSRFTLAHAAAETEALLATLPRRRGYRLTRTIARLVAAPFRLLPIALAARRALRS